MSIEPSGLQTITIGGERFVVLPESEYRQLVREAGQPPLPEPDAQGNYPAAAALRAVLARDILRERRALGLSQAELARRAGIRVETLNRLEQGRHSPNVETVKKIDRALEGARAAKGKPRGGGKRR